MRFADRRQAGTLLAQALTGYAGRPGLLVLAFPRGGLAVAFPVAQALKAPLDILVVRKLGVPWSPEFAFGAVASGGICVLNEKAIRSLEIPEPAMQRVREQELFELRRRETLYRAGRPPLQVSGKTVIVIDDGVATGSTMLAGLRALRQLAPSGIVVAVPVAPPDTVRQLKKEADEVICLQAPACLGSVGEWYADFTQVEDDEARAYLSCSTVG